jgi:lipopolysaccharide assembly outer membrane protein LptD (OstA)
MTVKVYPAIMKKHTTTAVKISPLFRTVGLTLWLSLFFILPFFAQDSLAVNLTTKKKALESDDTPWEITADSLSYNEKEGTYHAKDNVVIKKAGQALYTQSAVFNTKTGIATVSGGVRIETDGDIVTGKEGTFNLNTQTGEIINGRLFMKANHYYLSGSQMQKTGENTYLINDCTITTCDGKNPDWTITGSEVKVTIEGYGTVKKFRLSNSGSPRYLHPLHGFSGENQTTDRPASPQTGLLDAQWRRGADPILLGYFRPDRCHLLPAIHVQTGVHAGGRISIC